MGNPVSLRVPVTLTFLQNHHLPHHQVILARSGDTILDAALDNHIDLPHACGGNCACTTCHVIVEMGEGNLSLQEEVEADRLTTAAGRTVSSRLACQAILQGGDVVVFLVKAED